MSIQACAAFDMGGVALLIDHNGRFRELEVNRTALLAHVSKNHIKLEVILEGISLGVDLFVNAAPTTLDHSKHQLRVVFLAVAIEIHSTDKSESRDVRSQGTCSFGQCLREHMKRPFGKINARAPVV